MYSSYVRSQLALAAQAYPTADFVDRCFSRTFLRAEAEAMAQEEMVLDGITRLSLDLRVALGSAFTSCSSQYL